MRPMKIGLVLPLLEIVATGEKIPWATIRAQAMLAEEMGFDTLLVPTSCSGARRPGPGPAASGNASR